MKFVPSIGSEGFRVVSSFDITRLNCQQMTDDIHQLAILLYPSDSLNEKFLLKTRDCLLKLKEDHPLKLWLNSLARPVKSDPRHLEDVAFMTEMISSQFNLITDPKLKNKIIQTITEIPDSTLPEKLLKAYFYLMIGNVTKSDNIIRDYISRPPFENWQGFSNHHSPYHKLSRNYLDKILQKIFGHPTDRRSAELLGLYISSYMNDPALLEMISQNKKGTVDNQALTLRYIERMAPPLVHFLRFQGHSEERRIKGLRRLDKFPLSEQSYWDWAFLDIGPLISEPMVAELARIEAVEKLWFIYLMDDEKLSDWYVTKTKKSYLQGKRQFLHSQLDQKKTFMLALYKIIESGDVDSGLVQKTANFLNHE